MARQKLMFKVAEDARQDNSVTFENRSPWLTQLKDIRRPSDTLTKNERADIAVVGGGIAGVATAYFILKETRKSVMLLESHKIAHGATGHNAGQIVSYFEKPFFQIVEEYGFRKAIQGQKDILDAWKLLEDIYKQAKPKAQFSQFEGYAGCSTFQQLILHLENKHLRHKGGLDIEEVFVSENAPFLKEIPGKYRKLYMIVPHRTVMKLLETKETHYYAALGSRKGCLNSALFCEELIGYMLYKFKGRFKLFEMTPVERIELHKKSVSLMTKGHHTVHADRVVLCTNGFEDLHIVNKAGKEIDTNFHDSVYGIVGYMAAYIDPKKAKPTAISYFPQTLQTEKDAYFYLTRRDFSAGGKSKKVLVSVGGPEVKLDDKKEYIRDRPYFEKRQKEIDEFLKKNYIRVPGKFKYKYHWHGLMGYTTTGLRFIGPHPYNRNLLYNLGCNGVGILPSIHGGYKIAKFIKNVRMPKSIFDVENSLK